MIDKVMTMYVITVTKQFNRFKLHFLIEVEMTCTSNSIIQKKMKAATELFLVEFVISIWIMIFPLGWLDSSWTLDVNSLIRWRLMFPQAHVYNLEHQTVVDINTVEVELEIERRGPDWEQAGVFMRWEVNEFGSSVHRLAQKIMINTFAYKYAIILRPYERVQHAH